MKKDEKIIELLNSNDKEMRSLGITLMGHIYQDGIKLRDKLNEYVKEPWTVKYDVNIFTGESEFFIIRRHNFGRGDSIFIKDPTKILKLNARKSKSD